MSRIGSDSRATLSPRAFASYDSRSSTEFNSGVSSSFDASWKREVDVCGRVALAEVLRNPGKHIEGSPEVRRLRGREQRADKFM